MKKEQIWHRRLLERLTLIALIIAIDFSLKGGTITGTPPLISSPALYWTRYGGQVTLDTPIVLVCFDTLEGIAY